MKAILKVRRVLTVLVSIFMSCFIFSALAVNAAEPFGTDLGEFNGVIVYSNCDDDCVECNNYCQDQHYINGTYIGIKWQCVEYVRRYYHTVYNLDLASKWRGHANTWYDNAATMGLARFANGSLDMPQVGDILVSEGIPDVNVGHIAIIRDISDNSVCTIQQNFSNDSGDINRYLTLTVLDGNYTVGGFSSNYPIRGWLRVQPDLTLGLTAHYPFNGNANDQSGNENHGTVYGATLTTDMFGNIDSAYSFDGIDDYIAIPELLNPSISSFTVSSLALAANTTDFGLIVYKGTHKGEAHLSQNQDNFQFSVKLADHNWYYVRTPSVTVNEFIRIAGVYYRGDRIEIWVNSELINQIPISELNLFTQATHYSSIGTYNQGRTEPYFFKGIIDDVRIYNRALSQIEIQQLFWQTLGITHGEETILEEELTIYPGDEIDIFITIPDHCAQSTRSRIIQGSDVEMSLILPDGITIINRNTQDQNVYHILGSTYEAYQITDLIAGNWTVRLEGTDVPETGEAVSLTVSVDIIPNQPPTANAGQNQTVAVGDNCMADIDLDGSMSSDPDGDELTYLWTWDNGSATGTNPEIQLPLGVHAITLTVNDGIVDSTPDIVEVIVVDDIPPRITVIAVPDVLWPPNHKMVDINLTVEASDNCDAGLDIVLTSVVSSEPDDAPGGGDDGHTINDIQNAEIGAEDYTISLRAERLGTGDVRIYTITYTATDASGNSASASAIVTAPHNK